MQKHRTPEQFEDDLKLLESMAEQRLQEEKKEDSQVKLTLKDFVEIFEEIEREQGYEAARHYASVGINYNRLTEIAKSFVEGLDTNPDNDPNIMPTRFMLLYGADDSKLRSIDKHPDNFDGAPEHKITVTNLCKGLRMLGAKIPETGVYDDQLLKAHIQYISRLTDINWKRTLYILWRRAKVLGQSRANMASPHGNTSTRSTRTKSVIIPICL